METQDYQEKKGCGKPFGGENNNAWICGDFLDEDRDEEGRSFGARYFCDECNSKFKSGI